MERSDNKKFTLKISDPIFDKELQCFSLSLTIYDSEGNDVVNLQKPIEDFLNYLNELQKPQHRYLLFSYPSPLKYYSDLDNDAYISLAKTIHGAFDEILQREDILSDDITFVFFNGNRILKSDIYPLSLSHIDKISKAFNGSAFVYDEISQFAFICVDSSDPTSRLSRIWSFFEPETLGSFKIYKYTDSLNPLIMPPSFEKVYGKDFPTRCHCCLYNRAKNDVYIGFNDGKVLYSQFLPDMKKVMVSEYFNTGEDAVIDLKMIGSDILAVTTQSFKVMSPEGKIIGGGSLKKRLETAYITCSALDEKNRLIYLGTGKGTIFIYSYAKTDTYQLNYVDSITVEEDVDIECLVLEKNNLLVGVELGVLIFECQTAKKFEWKLISKFEPNQLARRFFAKRDSVLTDLRLVPERRLMIASYSSRAVLFWDTDTAQISGALQAHAGKIARISYNSNLLFTFGENSELCIWKMKNQKS